MMRTEPFPENRGSDKVRPGNKKQGRKGPDKVGQSFHERNLSSTCQWALKMPSNRLDIRGNEDYRMLLAQMKWKQDNPIERFFWSTCSHDNCQAPLQNSTGVEASPFLKNSHCHSN